PIGRAVSMQLALNGCFVVGLFPSAARSEAVAMNELTELGTLAHAFGIDPAGEAGAAEAAAEVERLFGRLDLLVNCLKYESESPFQTIAESEFLDVLKKNIGAAGFLTRAVLDLMADRPKPKIVNVTTAFADSGDPVFAASQAAIISLTRSFATSLPSKFRVNAVAVRAPAESEENEEDPLFRPQMKTASDDVARTILFLLSSESTLLNGEVVVLG
ncbi:MAG: SDR family oxidoreductase, partial [Acidobacteria bacterium]|nr:SDR family oxidoreductase [Acidobacteriota bacterium]